MPSIFSRLQRLIAHRWAQRRAHQLVSPDVLQRIHQHITASEQQHSGQVCVYIEGGLPFSYLWRNAAVRERALAIFGKRRVWDTAHNNGVLIYVLLADHAIEIIADRGLTQHTADGLWQDTVTRMASDFQKGAFEPGIAHAIDAVTACLSRHFPACAAAPQTTGNELPDKPVLRGR